MSKYYLVRRGMQSFCGPYTLSEVRSAFKRMEFGFQDEVSGHCGPWVQCDDTRKLAQVYPDILKIVQNNIEDGWSVSDHTAKHLIPERKREHVRQARKRLSLAFAFFVIALVAFGAAIFLNQGRRFASMASIKEQVESNGKVINNETAKSFLANGETEKFIEYVAPHVDLLSDQITRSKLSPDVWLPIIRGYAFLTDGNVGPVHEKYLKGTAIAAPLDCSEVAWRKRFALSYKQWSVLLEGRKQVRTHWARLLAWDPHWISRRKTKGWMLPQNYYAACILMADKALGNLDRDAGLGTNPPDFEKFGLSKLRDRVHFLKSVVLNEWQGVDVLTSSAVTTTVDAWTCMESSLTLDQLEACRSSNLKMSAIYSNYLEEKYRWNILRVLSRMQASELSAVSSKTLQTLTGINQTDFFTRFDYRAEQKWASFLAKGQVVNDALMGKMMQEFPDFNPVYY